MNLRVKPEILKTKAAEVELGIKELDKNFNAIQDIVQRSSGYWVGSVGERSRNDFESKKEEMLTVIKRFSEHPTDLLTMAGLYEEGEKSLTEQNQELNTDIIA